MQRISSDRQLLFVTLVTTNSYGIFLVWMKIAVHAACSPAVHRIPWPICTWPYTDQIRWNGFANRRSWVHSVSSA